MPRLTKNGSDKPSSGKVVPLEMEMESEAQSLMENQSLAKRNRRFADDDAEYGEVEGEEEEGSSEKCWGMTNNQRRAFLLFITLAATVGLFVTNMEQKVEAETMGVGGGPSQSDHVEYKAVHTGGSFGGINNVAHPGGAKAAATGKGIAFQDIIIPKSNVGHAIPSIFRENIVNLWGHYVHDEHRSPYASILYDATREELEERQQKYIEKMAKVREEWGAWDFRDPREGSGGETSNLAEVGFYRAVANFSKAPYKDLPAEEFPLDSWQADEQYVDSFLVEAKKLVHRVKEGIYAEYGYGSKDKDDNPRDEDFLKNREELWKIHVWDDSECEDGNFHQCSKDFKNGIANFQKHVFDALVRKLLHAMMTNDEFYVVLAGHSAAAGHGNNFGQNRIITFQHLMEPVFDKLGVRLISRNLAMGGVGTLQFSLAGGDIYGETDFLEWDSGMTEKGPPVDLFNKQAILSGERIPIIMNGYWFDILKETNATAWMGRYIPMNLGSLFDETSYENCKSQPYAARWIQEHKQDRDQKYNSICWEPRSDFTPLKMPQAGKPGGQASWHPGFRQMTWSGRKVALVMLEALGVALERWEKGVAEDGYPLASSYWHVEDIYKAQREILRTHINTPEAGAEDSSPRSQCENLFPDYPRICRLQMHGFGMWTPRATPYDFMKIVHAAPNGFKPDFTENNAYDGFDLLPLNQALPDDAVDPHLIAIATTNPAPDLDHSWIEDDEVGDSAELTGVDGVVDDTELPPPTRRRLREASEHAFRRGAEVFPPSNVVTEQNLQPITGAKHSISENTLRYRQLQNSTDESESIVPGRGWEVHGWKPVKGFCDGSAQAECGRAAEEQCMMYGANDNHLDLWGGALSGWLVFTVPKVREGIILLRIEWWCGTKGANTLIKDWTEVNNGMTTDTTPWNNTARRATVGNIMTDYEKENFHRELGISKDMLPKDLEFDYAINGVVKTMDYEEWTSHTMQPKGKNVAVVPVLNDVSMAERDWDGEPVEVAIRYRTKEKPKLPFCISHVYFA